MARIRCPTPYELGMFRTTHCDCPCRNAGRGGLPGAARSIYGSRTGVSGERLMTRPALRTESLTRHFAGTPAVAEVSLSLSHGESIALLGKSGCGKTTLLQMLGLLDRPSSGRVLLGEVDVWSEKA